MAKRKRECVITILLMVGCMCNAGELPELDPNKKLFQPHAGWGKPMLWPFGTMQQVRERDPVTVEELRRLLEQKDMRHAQEMKEQKREQLDKEHKLGGWIKLAGWILIALAAVAHGCSSFGPIKSAASTVLGIGFVGVLGGLAIQKMAEFDRLFNFALVVLAGVVLAYALYLGRNWSVSHLWKRKEV